MSNQTLEVTRRVRFEEVTPANEIVAFFDTQLKLLATRLHLSLYDGYDGLDNMQFAFLSLPSGKTVTLGQHEQIPESGVDLYVDLNTPDIPEIVVESCQRLGINRQAIVWIHPDFQEAIDQIYAQHGDVSNQDNSFQVEEISTSTQYEPIDCFQHALKIYTREEFPLYWAMLQHNLGLAYFDRSQENLAKGNVAAGKADLKMSIHSFITSQEIYTRHEFPEKWQINQEDLDKAQHSLDSLRHPVL